MTWCSGQEGMGFSCGYERMDRSTGYDIDLYTLSGVNAPCACRAHELPRESTATFHSHPPFVMTHIHQTITLYERTNPVNIQPGVVQADLVYKNIGHVKDFLMDARKLQILTPPWESTSNSFSAWPRWPGAAPDICCHSYKQPVRYSLVSVQRSTSGKQNVTVIPSMKEDSTKKSIQDVKTVATQTTGYTFLDNFPLATVSAF